MRALVTGAGGFVGRHLVAHLAAEGDDVVGVDRADGGCDILDAGAVRDLVADVRPDAVYHLAGWADVGGSWSAPVETFTANAVGTQHVLLACVAAGVDRVLAVSSADVYGKVAEADLPLTEASPLRPVSPYAASKVAADFLALQAFLGHGLPTVRARAFNHLGPGQTDKFVASALASRVAANEVEGADEVRVGNLSSRRDFTDVRDVVRAYRLLVLHGEPGEAYNVCSGRDVAVQDLADRLVAMASVPMLLKTDPALERPVDVPVLRGDNARLRAATGWEPSIPIEQTLADLLDDWRRRLRAG
ncbi:MAG TPA: GDP-mannose 4,6-dehydratase [Acidimicrobiales bacterium]|jgi:GDP-4-dehydro-6-deoxy-D-mannose reductase